MSMQLFTVKKSDMDKRWDPFYFQPNLVKLEAKVKAKTSLRLRDFVRSMAGGATPLKSEGDQHYTDAKDGIPFIRVQNLSTTGSLDLADVKHITKATHDGLLARSQLSGGELLVKITGVGRMAVASVVPEGFSANINQHIVAIKTANIEQSKSLAVYINLDFVEQLASRRATGGTRPALDYPALLSLPIIEDSKILEIIDNAQSAARVFETEAEALLSKVDTTLFGMLGLVPPTQTSTAHNIFVRQKSQLNDRFDALFHQVPLFDFLQSTPIARPLAELAYSFVTGFAAGKADQESDEGVVQIRPTNFDDGRRLIFDRNVYVPASLLEESPADILKPGEVLFNNTNSQELVGKTALFDVEGPYFCSNHITRITTNPNELLAPYLVYVLNAYQRSKVFYRMCVNWNNQSGVNVHALRKLPIPLPDTERQGEIVACLMQIEMRAYGLQREAQKTLVAAKQKVEQMILGD